MGVMLRCSKEAGRRRRYSFSRLAGAWRTRWKTRPEENQDEREQEEGGGGEHDYGGGRRAADVRRGRERAQGRRIGGNRCRLADRGKGDTDDGASDEDRRGDGAVRPGQRRGVGEVGPDPGGRADRKSTRLN